MTRTALVLGYLSAIVVANLTLAEWGREHPEVALYNAFVLVGLDLVARDLLHSSWAARGHLWRNMAILIASGSAISYGAGLWIGSGPDVGRIALASCVAFAAAATTDALVYQALRRRAWLERVNGSNVLSAAVDSAVFIALWPFGWSFPIAFGLFTAKVAGGVVWASLLQRLLSRRDIAGRPTEYPLIMQVEH
jgi:queuosine precursor transporter